MASKREDERNVSGEQRREEQLWSPVGNGPDTAVSEIETALRNMKYELEQAKLDKVERERYLKLKEVQIHELQRKLEEKESAMPNNIEEILRNKDREIEGIVKEKDHEIKQLLSQLKRSTIEVFEIGDQLKAKQLAVVKYKDTIKTQSLKIEELNDTIELMGGRITELTNRLWETSNEREELKEKLFVSKSPGSGKLKRRFRNKKDSEKDFEKKGAEKITGESSLTSLTSLEEEKLVLTRQVNAYSDQCDSLKRRLQEIHDNHAIEVEKLNTELQSITHDGGHLNAVSAQLETERERNRKLTEQLATERKNSEALNIKIDEFRERMYTANKVLKEKVDYYESENMKLRKEKLEMQRIIQTSSNNIVSSSDPFGYHTPHYDVTVGQESRSANTSEEYVANGGVPPLQKLMSVDSQICNLKPAKLVPLLGRDREKGHDETLMRLEEQSKKEREEADRALRDLEETRREVQRDRIQFTPGLLPSSPLPPVAQNDEVSAPVFNPPQLRTEHTSDVIPENPLIQSIDREIQENAQWVRDQSKRPTTAEVEIADDDSTLPYDPNLVCPKCGKRYHIGGIQMFRRHVKELCPLLEQKRDDGL